MSPCFSRRFILAILLVGLAPAVALSQGSSERGFRTTREELLKLHNEHRQKEGLKALTISRELTKAAQEYAEHMAESGEFGHKVKGTPRSRIKEAGYEAKAGGENIAMGQPSSAAVFKDWLESKTHKENILSEEFTEVGFGIAKDKNGDLLWVADYGDR